MKPYVIVLIILLVGVCIPFVSAGNNIDNPKNDTHLTQAPKEMVAIEKPTTIILEPPVMKVLKVEYIPFTSKSLTDQIVSAIKDALFGKEVLIEEEPTETEQIVVLEGRTMAIIPTDSKFKGIQMHEVCLPLQYGTDEWYACEVTYEGK